MSSKEYYSPQASSRFANPSVQATKTLLHEDHHEDRSVNGTVESDLPLEELNDKSNKPNRSRSQSFSFSPSSPHLFKLRLDPSKPMLENEFDIDTEKGNYGSRWSFEKKAFSTEVESSDEGEDLEEQKRQLETITQIKKDLPVRTEGRLLIVANRLPLSMKVVKKPPTHEGGKERKELTFSSSSGGLVSALSGCDIESRWIGWPGAEVKRTVDKQSVMHKLEEQNCVPVFLSQSLADAFYNGFCNNILWPLFHYIPLDVDSISKADDQFEAYQVANQNFADVLLNTYQEGDVVWVHDYHCLLMPRILRQRYPTMKIGFFFHTPFPAFEVLRVMPSREELLAGVLSADLIGFHTADYMHNFSNACARILGATINGDEITYQKFTARVGAFPIGIDPKRFIQTIESSSIEKYMEEYKKEFQGKKVLLGIDRLDYIKGIQHKIYALERLFEKYPEMAKEVVLVQIAVPSRTDVLEYQKLKSATHKLVGRVNGTYGSVSSSPIHYLDQSIPFEKMCALYRVADVLVVTSIRDGMNLVCYEYIACQKDMAGALVLSEFAGAAQCLTGPLIVNPWSVASVSEAMRLALTMPEEERRERNAQMFEQVSQNTSSHWARRFLSGLLHATKTPLSWLPGLQSIGNDVAHVEEIQDAPVSAPAAVVPDKVSPRDSPARSMLPSALR